MSPYIFDINFEICRVLICLHVTYFTMLSHFPQVIVKSTQHLWSNIQKSKELI